MDKNAKSSTLYAFVFIFIYSQSKSIVTKVSFCDEHILSSIQIETCELNLYGKCLESSSFFMITNSLLKNCACYLLSETVDFMEKDQ